MMEFFPISKLIELAGKTDQAECIQMDLDAIVLRQAAGKIRDHGKDTTEPFLTPTRILDRLKIQKGK